jgi:hypothetical protein
MSKTTADEPSTREIGGRASDVVRKLIARYANAPRTFTLTVDGETFTFRRVLDTVEQTQLYAQQQAFGREASTKRLPGALGEVTPCLDASVAEAAYLLSELSVEPKLTQYEALLIARQAEPIFTALMRGIVEETKPGAMAIEIAQVEQSKNGSARTRSGETT